MMEKEQEKYKAIIPYKKLTVSYAIKSIAPDKQEAKEKTGKH